jgi:hypothetical protein
MLFVQIQSTFRSLAESYEWNAKWHNDLINNKINSNYLTEKHKQYRLFP